MFTLHPSPSEIHRRRLLLRGFSLIELMVVIAIMAILLGVAAPALRDFVAGQRVKAASFDLASAVALARSEAIKRNAAVTVKPNSGTAWESGWKVETTGAVTTISEQQATSGLTIAGPASLQFSGTGRNSTGPNNFTLTATGTTTSIVKCTRVDLNGIASTRSGSCV